MVVRVNGFFKYYFIFFIFVIILSYLFKSIGYIGKDVLYLFFLPILVLFFFKNYLSYYYLGLLFIYVLSWALSTVNSQSYIHSIIYGAVFLIYAIVFNLVLVQSNKVFKSSFFSLILVVYISILFIASFLNGLIGLDWYQPFTLNISVLDLIAVPVLMFIFLEVRPLVSRVIGIILLFFLAILHDADAVFAISLLLIFYSVLRRFLIIQKLVVWFAGNFYFLLFFITLLVYFVLSINGVGEDQLYLGQKGLLKEEGVSYYKRLILIYEGYYFSLSSLLLGYGYGVENYFLNTPDYVHNTPQVLPLTVLLYSGFLGYFAISLILNFLSKKILKGSINKPTVAILLISYNLMLLIHEYLFNPFAWFGLIVIVYLSTQEKFILPRFRIFR